MSVATPREETAALLRRVPVFASLTDEDLVKVAEVAVQRRFGAGEVVFREGDESNTCYVVRTGKVRALRAHSDGRSIALANFAAGDIFGELAMFDNESRSATVETLEPTEVIAILGGDMRRLMREYPEITIRLNAALAQKLRATNERLARQSFQTVQSRVASVLVQLVEVARNQGAKLLRIAGRNVADHAEMVFLRQFPMLLIRGRGKAVESGLLDRGNLPLERPVP